MRESAGGAGTVQATEERHASRLELFFDLIVVAGVGQLAHLLYDDPGFADLGLYTLMFLAFWTVWMLFALYGNVAAEKIHMRVLMAGMFGMAMMAAAVPGVREDKATVFALAYVVVRLIASSAGRERGQVLVDVPIVQMSTGLVPWVISLWTEGTTQYTLWAVGLGLDLLIMITMSSERVEAEVQERLDRMNRSRRTRREPRGGPRGPRPGRPAPTVSLTRTETGHLDERLGLFLLIMLGESLIQMVDAAGESTWDGSLYGVAIGAFFLLLQLWSLSLRHGTNGVPLLRSGAIPVRTALPLHCFTAGTVAAMAAALGGTIKCAGEEMPDAVQHLLCGTVTIYLALAAIASLASGRGLQWTLTALVPPTLAVGLMALLQAVEWTPVAVVWVLVASTRWPIYWLRRAEKTADPGAVKGGVCP
ncbi:low temperature requirement protein A [Streptomyces fractus]|uniref:low temperature requirement protein A n=1 Tax=Streptomyces fractus TaxID=641806 RepID=UPI003CF37C9E